MRVQHMVKGAVNVIASVFSESLNITPRGTEDTSTLQLYMYPQQGPKKSTDSVVTRVYKGRSASRDTPFVVTFCYCCGSLFLGMRLAYFHFSINVRCKTRKSLTQRGCFL